MNRWMDQQMTEWLNEQKDTILRNNSNRNPCFIMVPGIKDTPLVSIVLYVS